MPLKKDIMNIIKVRKKYILIIFIVTIVILAYFLPTYLTKRPFGTDAYTHLVYTTYITEVDSIHDFHELLTEKKLKQELEYGGYTNYPFGLWLFGSLISKVTGLGPYTVASILPLVLLAITLSMFYTYTSRFLDLTKERLFSIAFLLSMPIISTYLLCYRPSVFVIPLLLSALYLSLNRKKPLLRDLVLIIMAVFCICITHTGTYMFLMLFVITYLFLYALLWGKLQREMYVLIVIILAVYASTVSLFPTIQSQYTLKSTLILTVGDFISSKTNLGFISEFSKIFYKEIFVNGSLIYVTIWSAFLYGVIMFIIFLRTRLPKSIPGHHNQLALTLPLLGRVERISHSIVAAPFWIGPIHSFFTIPGFFKLNKTGKCVLLTIILVTFIPGALHTGPTGSLREIYYSLIIIPIAATLGFYWILNRLEKSLGDPLRKILMILISLSVALVILVMPMVGNIYYLPTTSGADYEINAMRWLSGIGTSEEKCIGIGYRQLSTYTKKPIVDAEYGAETRKLSKDLQRIHFYQNSEEYVRDLYYTFGVNYIISSDRVIRNLGGTIEELKIDSNTELDNVYSSKDFGIYTCSPISKKLLIKKTIEQDNLRFDETSPKIQDRGFVYLIETDTYKVNMDKEVPRIRYLGDSQDDFLGGGYLEDYLRLSWYGGPYHDKFSTYVLNDLKYPVIESNENQVVYKTDLKDRTGNETWATLIVKYTFYEKILRKEVIIANDMLPFNRDSTLAISLTNMQFSPLPQFTYKLQDRVEVKKRAYPSDDEIRLKDTKFNEIYFTDGDKGIYIQYDRTSPYPSEIRYRGSTSIDYSSKDITTTSHLSPSDSVHITNYISLGDKETAKRNVDNYMGVSLYPYPNGEIPIILISYLNRFNTLSGVDFNNSLNTYDILKDLNISYTEGIPVEKDEVSISKFNQLSGYGIHTIGYLDLYDNTYDDLILQKEKVRNMLNNSGNYYNISLMGIIPNNLGYNLKTIKALEDEKLDFAVVISVRPPFMEFNQEGLRHPRLAYYHGNKTNVVLLPVSQPDSSYLRQGLKTEDTISAWKSTINSVKENDDLCLLLLKSKDIGKPEYGEDILEVITYAQNERLSFTDPHTISYHFKLLQNISAFVSRGPDFVIINLDNRNIKPVNGTTYRVTMPRINGKCSCHSVNGVINRVKEKGLKCTYYISTNMEANEKKTMVIEPSINRNRFSVVILGDPIEGIVTILIGDGNSNPVREARVAINEKEYATGEEGIITTNLRRGVYNVKVEKPGFITEDYKLEIKGNIYYLETTPIWIYLIPITAIMLFIVYQKIRRKKNK